MKRFGSFLVLGLFAVCANAGTIIVVNDSNLAATNWTQEDDGGSSSFVYGPATPPLGVGSFQTTIGAAGEGSALYTNSYVNGVDLTAITSIGFSTYAKTAAGTGDFDIVIGLTDGDSLFYQPPSGSVVSGEWQNWDATSGLWYDANGDLVNGQLTYTLSDYAAAFGGTINVLGVQAGYQDNLTAFTGNVDALSIQTTVLPSDSSGLAYTFDFDPTSAVPEPSTWMSLGGGLLLVGFALSRRIGTRARV